MAEGITFLARLYSASWSSVRVELSVCLSLCVSPHLLSKQTTDSIETLQTASLGCLDLELSI